jgi:hypothetical protein
MTFFLRGWINLQALKRQNRRHCNEGPAQIAGTVQLLA